LKQLQPTRPLSAPLRTFWNGHSFLQVQQVPLSDRKSDILRGAAFFLLLISPVGAPIVGWALMSGCDIPWEGTYDCQIPKPIIDYFVPFTILPWLWVGPFLAIMWFLMAAATWLVAIWYVMRAVWHVTGERL
jgi:hypothetical protein